MDANSKSRNDDDNKTADSDAIKFVTLEYDTTEHAQLVSSLTLGDAWIGQTEEVKKKLSRLLQNDTSGEIIILALQAEAKKYKDFMTGKFKEAKRRVQVWTAAKFTQARPHFSKVAVTEFLKNSTETTLDNGIGSAIRNLAVNTSSQDEARCELILDFLEQLFETSSACGQETEAKPKTPDSRWKDSLNIAEQDIPDFVEKLNLLLKSKVVGNHVFVDVKLVDEADNDSFFFVQANEENKASQSEPLQTHSARSSATIDKSTKQSTSDNSKTKCSLLLYLQPTVKISKRSFRLVVNGVKPDSQNPEDKTELQFTSVEDLGGKLFETVRLGDRYMYPPVFYPNSGLNLPLEAAASAAAAAEKAANAEDLGDADAAVKDANQKTCKKVEDAKAFSRKVQGVHATVVGDSSEQRAYDELKRFSCTRPSNQTVYVFHSFKLPSDLRNARINLFPKGKEDAESYEIDFVVLIENTGVVIIEVKSNKNKIGKAKEQLPRHANAIQSYLGVSHSRVFKLFCHCEDDVVNIKEFGEAETLSLEQHVEKWREADGFEKSQLDKMAKTLLLLHHLKGPQRRTERLQGNTLTLNFEIQSYEKYVTDQNALVDNQNVAGTVRTVRPETIPEARYRKADDDEVRFIGIKYWTKEQADCIEQASYLTVGAAGTGKSVVLKAKVLKLLKSDVKGSIVILASHDMAEKYKTFVEKLRSCSSLQEASGRVEVWNVADFQRELPEFSNEAFTSVLQNFIGKIDSQAQSNAAFSDALRQYCEDFVAQLIIFKKQPEDLREQIRGMLSPFFKDSSSKKRPGELTEYDIKRSSLAEKLKEELKEVFDFFHNLNQSLKCKFKDKHVFIDDLLALEAENVPQLLAHTIGLHVDDWLPSDCQNVSTTLHRVFYLDPAQLVLKVTEPEAFRFFINKFIENAEAILRAAGLNVSLKGMLSEELIRSLLYTISIEYSGFFLGEMMVESKTADRKQRTCMLRTVMRCGTKILDSWQPVYNDLLSGTCFQDSEISEITSGHATAGLCVEKTLTLDAAVAYIDESVAKLSDYAVIARVEESVLKKLREMFQERFGETLAPRAAHETVSLEWATVFYIDDGHKVQDKYGPRIHEYIAKSRCRAELHHLKITLLSPLSI